jgi:hypothetical protein
MNDPVASIAQIKRQAEHAADNNHGSCACQYPVESEAFRVWVEAYYARVKFNAEQVAA